MKKLIVILLFLFAVGPVANAQNEVLFSKATEAYNKARYSNAIELYTKILNNGKHSSELYFNLGNCYYKLDEIGLSIYYYEKALLLNPTDQEIKNNLAYAENMRLDAISTVPKTFMARVHDQAVGLLNYNQWGYLAIVFVILFVLCYIVYYLLSASTPKRIAFVTSIIALILCVSSLFLGYLNLQDYKKDNPAIILKREITVKAEPNKKSESLFALHEGTKVNIEATLDSWKKIKISDGQTGWVEQNVLKSLKDF